MDDLKRIAVTPETAASLDALKAQLAPTLPAHERRGLTLEKVILHGMAALTEKLAHQAAEKEAAQP